MGKPRSPRATRSGRSVESEQWQKKWQSKPPSHSKRASTSVENEAVELLSELHFCLGYDFKAFSATILALSVLGLDGTDWRKKIKKLPQRRTGDDRAAAIRMEYLVELKGWNITRAAQCTVSDLNLYRTSSWEWAVKRCSNAWRKYRTLPHDQTNSSRIGLGSRSNFFPSYSFLTVSLPPKFICWIADPSSVKVFSPGEKYTVMDNEFWRRAIEQGLVVEVKGGE